MKRLYVTAALAIVGVVIAIVAVVRTNRPPVTETSPLPSQVVPFTTYVAGTGITETGRGNVSIGAAVAGVVGEVHVRVGDQVKAGDPLFRIDDRDLQARLVVARANVREAQAALAKPRHRLAFLTNLQHIETAAMSVEALSIARDDVEAAESALGAARAVAAQIHVDIERSVVRAATAGRVLQVNIRVGEFAANSGAAKPLMMVGSDTRLYLRVDIDENDAWRVRPGTRGVAFVRGNPGLAIPLRFEYLEPYVTPKTSLTGQGTERSDLRVLQIVYSFGPTGIPVYLGQQMDAFIEVER
ncbi:MAG: efflux RND transporter periplasmic adaptor subunit [Gammaproteobacteria bacterium]